MTPRDSRKTTGNGSLGRFSGLEQGCHGKIGQKDVKGLKLIDVYIHISVYIIYTNPP